MFRSLGRAIGVSPQKINANLKNDGTFSLGYNEPAKTRKNSRFEQIQSKVSANSSGAKAIHFVSTVRSAYEGLSFVKTKESRDLAKRFHLALKANILMFGLTPGYKNELMAYNDFLHDYFSNINFDKAVKSREEQTTILTKWSDVLSGLLKESTKNNSATNNAAVNEVLAQAKERATLNMFSSMPAAPSTPIRGGRTRKMKRTNKK